MAKERISVTDAADHLGVSPQQIRALLGDGLLEGVKLGGRWLVDHESIDRLIANRRGPGRPLSPENAWGFAWLLGGERPDWVKPWTLSRLRHRRDVEELLPGLSRRAEWRRFRAHSGELSRMSDDARLVLAGVSAARHHGANVVTRRELEAYVKAKDLRGIVRDHKLDPNSDEPNVSLRVVHSFWPFSEEAREVPVGVAIIDLLESPDARTKRAGRELLRRRGFR